jgi:hypothetical protein
MPKEGLTDEQFIALYGMNRASFDFWLGDLADVEFSPEKIEARRARIAARTAKNVSPNNNS